MEVSVITPKEPANKSTSWFLHKNRQKDNGESSITTISYLPSLSVLRLRGLRNILHN